MGKDLLKLIGSFPDAYHPLLFIFLIIGLLTRWDKDYIKPAIYISSFIIPYFLGYIIFHPGRRYLVNWVPLTLFLGAIGFDRINRWINMKFKPSKGLSTVLLLVIIIILLPKTLEGVREDGLKLKRMGLWIKENSKGKISVMAEDRRLAFYADADYIPWDRDRIKDVDYIVTEKYISSLKEIYCTTNGMRIYHGSSE